MKTPDVQHFRRRETHATVATLADHVVQVVSAGPEEKMGRIAAGRIVAMMADTYAMIRIMLRNRAMGETPGNPIATVDSLAIPDPTIS
jgi:hypothetical protein